MYSYSSLLDLKTRWSLKSSLEPNYSPKRNSRIGLALFNLTS